MADLTQLANILRAAGLTVVEVDGWKTRGRPGAFAPTRVLCHHTGGPGNGLRDAEAMAKVGRPDLKPPLVQLALDRQGVWYVLAAGRANHAGRCRPLDGLHTYAGGRAYGDGNEQMVGVEAQNDGKEPWPDVQYASYVRGVAAITNAYGWRPPLGHKETSLEGKPDPHDIDMNQFRRDVAATNPQEEDTMSAAEVQEIKDHINAVALYGYYEKGKPGKQPSILQVLAETQRRVTVSATEVKALTSGMGAAVASAVSQAVAASDGPLPDADVERIATAAAEKFAEGFEVDLKPVRS